jgi:hypothetical protein
MGRLPNIIPRKNLVFTVRGKYPAGKSKNVKGGFSVSKNHL